MEREQGRRDATEDLSEDFSEGEKGDGVGEIVQPETPIRRLQRNSSNVEVWSDDKKENRLYVVLIRYFPVSFLLLPLIDLNVLDLHKGFVKNFSLHGLVRGENMELGSDSDTGGQVHCVSKVFNKLESGISGFNLFSL